MTSRMISGSDPMRTAPSPRSGRLKSVSRTSSNEAEAHAARAVPPGSASRRGTEPSVANGHRAHEGKSRLFVSPSFGKKSSPCVVAN